MQRACILKNKFKIGKCLVKASHGNGEKYEDV